MGAPAAGRWLTRSLGSHCLPAKVRPKLRRDSILVSNAPEAAETKTATDIY